MQFSSYTFLFIFLPLVLLLYFLIRKNSLRNFLLCIFSLVFYAWGEPKYILLMLLSIMVNYFLALGLEKWPKIKKVFLILSIIINIALLGYFKYFNFVVEALNGIFKVGLSFKEIILPVGISFYTFQILSYIIDVYRKEVKAQKNIIKLALYISFFPQLIAGPIVKYSDIAEEIDSRKSSVDDIIYGIKRFIIGLAKKIIIANGTGYVANLIYGLSRESVGTLFAWLAFISYALQIYYDFSGYSDMAIGLGRIFGFHFKENFNSPYTAISVNDFWHKWHISLTSWFRSYVYIPMGGNRTSKLKWVRNIILVWFLTGLWHGASWNFIVWGLYFAFFIILEKTILKKWLKKRNHFLGWFLTMFIVCVSWVIFRSESLTDAFGLLKALFIYKTTEYSYVFNDFESITSLYTILLGIICILPIFKSFWHKIIQKYPFLVIGEYLALLFIFWLSLAFMLSNSYNPFIYFRF